MKSLGIALSILFLFPFAGVADSNNSPGNNTPRVLRPGSTTVLKADTTVLVPAGTTVDSPNGSRVNINGSTSVVNTVAGAVVTVRKSATGVPNNLVRTVDSTMTTQGVAVTVLAGSNNTSGKLADGAGSAAVLWAAGGTYLKFDANDNIIFSDRGKLRRLAPNGTVSTYGNHNLLVGSSGVAVDAGGNIFAVGNAKPGTWDVFLQELSANGTVNMIAPAFESGNVSGGHGGLDIDAGGNFYFADRVNNRIMEIRQDGVATVFAGTGTAGFRDGERNVATFDSPSDVAIDQNGDLFVADSGNNAIRKIAADGTVTTYAAGFVDPVSYVALDKSGTCYAAGMVTLYVVDSGTVLKTISLNVPLSGLAVDGQGNLYTKMWSATAELVRITLQ